MASLKTKQKYGKLTAEAALQRCSYKKFFWKNTANLQENLCFIELALPRVCSPVNLLHIFRTSFPNIFFFQKTGISFFS